MLTLLSSPFGLLSASLYQLTCCAFGHQVLRVRMSTCLGFSCEKVKKYDISSLFMSPPFTFFQTSINGVVWYILGVNFVLSFYPQDVATVAILM
jgi:hypothetical protein